MKRIISLKKVSPFLTEVFRDNAKIGTIDYKDPTNYEINLDDAIAQAVMDAEVAAIKKELEAHMNSYTAIKKEELDKYKNEILIVDLTNIKNNYKAELETTSTIQQNKIKSEGEKQIQEVGLVGATNKTSLEKDYLNYKTELESIVGVHNIEKLIGDNFRGAYNPFLNYKNGDIYYKASATHVGFSIPNNTTGVLNKSTTLIELKQFKIHGDIEQKFELGRNKEQGVVGLDLRHSLRRTGESNTTLALFPNRFNIVSFSIPNNETGLLPKSLNQLDISTIIKTNTEMLLNNVSVGTVEKYQY